MTKILEKDGGSICQCGKLRLSIYSCWLKRLVFGKWCQECQDIESNKLAKQAETEKAFKIRRSIKREIDKAFWGARLTDFNEAIQTAIADKPKKRGIFVWGKTGTGKSHLASAIVKLFLVAGKRAKMVGFEDMLLEVKASYNANHTEESVYWKYISCDFLSIEDLALSSSAKFESAFVQKVLMTVTDARINRELPTMITTNLSPETVWNSFGERLGSRFHTFLTFKLEGQDRRLEGK